MQIKTRCKNGEGQVWGDLDEKGVKIPSVIEYEIGDSLKAAVKLFGEDVVYSVYSAGAKVEAQRVIRGMMEEEKSEEEIQAFMDTYKLGVKVGRGGDPVKAIIAKLNDPNIDAKEKAKQIKRLEDALAAVQA